MDRPWPPQFIDAPSSHESSTSAAPPTEEWIDHASAGRAQSWWMFGSNRRLGLVVSVLWWALSALIVFTAAASAQPSVAPTLPRPWIDTSDRDAVQAAYRAEYRDQPEDIDWTGDHDRCQAGDSSDRLRAATLGRINFYRAMAGVDAAVTIDAEYSRQAQHAALMMSAEGALSHDPDPSFACYGEAGHRAAANSNLYLGRVGRSAIDGYIEDPGDGNTDVGHRQTILHPPTKRMGVGHVEASDSSYAANALWVFDDHVFDDDRAVREQRGFVAWPPRGFVPERVVYPRWSFALAEADLSRAQVSMTVDGQPVPLTVIERISKRHEVPSSVLVWEPDGLLADIGDLTPSSPDGERVLDADLAVEVVVTGVVPASADPAGADLATTGQATSYRYQVVIMAQPDRSMVMGIVDASAPVAVAAAKHVSQAAFGLVP